MATKSTTAPSSTHLHYKIEGAVNNIDPFENTWDRYLRALEDMRKLDRERRAKITTLMENLYAARDRG